MKKQIFILVGPPATGKSTWVFQTFKEAPYIINRDVIVEEVASMFGITYDDTFKAVEDETIKKAKEVINNRFFKRIKDAVRQDKDIVVDMTHMSAKSRKKSLEIIKGYENEYNKIAIIFNFSGSEDIIKKVAQQRSVELQEKGKTKTITDDVFDKMLSMYQEVTDQEGFDQILHVDNIPIFRNLIRN